MTEYEVIIWDKKLNHIEKIEKESEAENYKNKILLHVTGLGKDNPYHGGYIEIKEDEGKSLYTHEFIGWSS